jgi:hypothetical protein
VAVSVPFLTFACIFAGFPEGSFLNSTKTIPWADAEGLFPTKIRSGLVLFATIT